MLMVVCLQAFPLPETYLVKRSTALFNIVVEIVQLLSITITPHARIFEHDTYVEKVESELSGNLTSSVIINDSGDFLMELFEGVGFQCPFEYSAIGGMYAALQLSLIALVWAVVFTELFRWLSRQFPERRRILKLRNMCLAGRWRVFSVVFAMQCKTV